MKAFGRFMLGFVMAFIIMTCLTPIHSLNELVPFIGPSLLGGIIYLSEVELRDRLDRIEKILERFLKD